MKASGTQAGVGPRTVLLLQQLGLKLAFYAICALFPASVLEQVALMVGLLTQDCKLADACCAVAQSQP
jgi:hypothetical protein